MEKVKKKKQELYNEAFPSLLRNLLIQYDVTQEELGKHLKVSRQAISNYMNGVTTPDIYTFQKIVDFFRKEKRVNYSYEYWLGTVNINTELGEYSTELPLSSLGLSNKSLDSIFAFHNSPEMKSINEFLENLKLIQLFQDFLGDEPRDDKEHIAFPTVKDTIDTLFKISSYTDFKFSPDDLYDELKLKEIVKELKAMRKKKPKKFNETYKL